MSDTNQDAPVSPAEAEAEAPMTSKESYERFKALAERIDKAATKTMLVYFVANGTIANGVALGVTHAAMDEAETRLLERLKGWGKAARSENAWKRTRSLLQKIKENREADEAGRRPPHKFKTPKQRKARRAKP